MTEIDTPTRCRATTWIHGRLIVCDRPPEHQGAHTMRFPNQVEWTWTDRESPTIYPRERP